MMTATWAGRRAGSRPASARRCRVSGSKVLLLTMRPVGIEIMPLAYRRGVVIARRDYHFLLLQTRDDQQPEGVGPFTESKGSPPETAVSTFFPDTQPGYVRGTAQSIGEEAIERLQLGVSKVGPGDD